MTQAQEKDCRALKICLQEIERCKPYFMCMLGDSYGSLTPKPQQLLKAMLTELQEEMSRNNAPDEDDCLLITDVDELT